VPTLGELTASTQRLALVGLAKNTGKTVALNALLRELDQRDRRVGVTSVGRDGEERDALDARIEKPRVELAAGSLVATTDGLLRASGLPNEPLEDAGVRTPLGRVLVARLRSAGAIEVAGPSAAADVRAVADAMLAHGAEQVLIDGAIDRRAASSPDVADGLLMATGAILDADLEQVVARTRDAVELVRLPPPCAEQPVRERLRDLCAGAPGESMLANAELAARPLPRRFVLTAEAEEVAGQLDASPDANWLLVAGALPERFLLALVHPLKRRRRELTVVVSDPTRVFLWKRGPAWFARQGVNLRALNATELKALTVNPLAPRSHRFDSRELRAALSRALPSVPVLDVLHRDYPALEAAEASTAGTVGGAGQTETFL